MYCAACGNKIKEDILFCTSCGYAVKNPNNNLEKDTIEKPNEERGTYVEDNTQSDSSWNLFSVENNALLENKVWFRLLKVAQGISIVCVVFFSLLIAYFLFDAKSLSTATLTCDDGTTWNAMDPDYTTLELNAYEKCGLCNKRLQNNTYYTCDYNEGSQKLYNSYTVNRTYEKDNSILTVLGWSCLSLFGGLLLAKLTAKIIVYILGGRNKT